MFLNTFITIAINFFKISIFIFFLFFRSVLLIVSTIFKWLSCVRETKRILSDTETTAKQNETTAETKETKTKEIEKEIEKTTFGSEKVKKRARVLKNLKDLHILETWFAININYPYASPTDFEHLSILTGLDVEKIKKWLSNARSKLEIKPRKVFSLSDVQILMNNCNSHTNQPGPADLQFLSELLQKESNQIKYWFIRFRKSKNEKMNI